MAGDGTRASGGDPCVGDARVAVYDHSSWRGYLLQRLLPSSIRLHALPDDSPEDIIARIPTSVSTFIFHIDLTCAEHLPAQREVLGIRLRDRGIDVMNQGVVDISKRRLQQSCALIGIPTTTAVPHGAPDDLLIIKTNRNYGGLPELLSRSRLAGHAEVAGGHSSGPPDYLVARRAEIGAEVWTTPDFVVENYISNAEGRMFRAVIYGSTVAFLAFESHRSVDRVPADCTLVSAPAQVPVSVRAVVSAYTGHCRIGYGALDVLIDDAGRAYIIDFNSTPFWGTGLLGPLRSLIRRASDEARQ